MIVKLALMPFLVRTTLSLAVKNKPENSRTRGHALQNLSYKQVPAQTGRAQPKDVTPTARKRAEPLVRM